eukprot:COSAG02_NODE_1313_length_13317_cov_77.434483_2_plen_878_part_00
MGRVMERVAHCHGCTQLVAARGGAVVTLSLLSVALLTLGMLLLSGQQLLLGAIPIDNDFMTNFALHDSHQYESWKQWEEHFPAPRSVELLLEADDILQPAVMAAARQLESDVEDLVVTFQGRNYGWADVCHRACSDGPCTSTSLFAGTGPWADATMTLPTTRSDIVDTLTVVGSTAAGAGLLRLTVGLAAGPWTSATSYSSVFYLTEHWSVGDETSNPGIEWELAFIERMARYNHPPELTAVHYRASRSFSDEILDVVQGDLLLFLPTAVIMVMYSTVVLRKNSPIQDTTQTLLAASSLLSPMMATPASWGIMGYLHLNINVLCIMAPFIALAVGIDNSFVMISFVQRLELTDAQDVPKAVREAMTEAGPAIFLTMITDVIAFLVATLTNVGMLKGFVNFCLLMSLALGLNYMLQVTMFTALISLDLQRKLAKNSRDKPTEELVSDDNAQQSHSIAASSNINSGERELGGLRKFFGGRYAHWLSRPVVSLTVVLSAICVLAISLYCATLADVGMPDNYFLLDDADLAKWNDANDRLFGGGLAPVSVLADIDYRLQSHVSATEGVVSKLVARQDVVIADSWLAAYQQWRNQLASAGVPATDELTSLGEFLEVFPDYRQDVMDQSTAVSPPVFVSDVSLSRLVVFQLQLPPSSEVDLRLSQYNSIMKEFSDLPFDTTVASPVFALHIGRIERMRGLIFSTVGFTIAAVFGALLMFIPPSAAAICALNICFVVGDVLGSVYYLGASFNAITFTTCVMAVGFCVDYSVHVIHFYSHANAATSQGRVTTALFLCGPDVLHGAATTFLGTGLLLVGNSYAFRVFARMTVAVVLIGAVHGLLVLPAFLALVGDHLECCHRGTRVEPTQDIARGPRGTHTTEDKP